jgi:hypothetical protein
VCLLDEEAVAARIIHRLNSPGELDHFRPASLWKFWGQKKMNPHITLFSFYCGAYPFACVAAEESAGTEQPNDAGRLENV